MAPTLGKRLGNGRAAEVFEYGEGRVIKVWREPGNPEWMAREAHAQEAVIAAGVAAPAVIETTTIDGRNGLVMQRVEGVDGLTAALQKPWRIYSIGKGIGRLHRQLGTVPAPDELDGFADRTRYVLNLPEFPAELRARLLPLLEKAPAGNSLLHMDFHPGNIMQTEAGPVVIDFANAQAGHPIADHIQSMLLLTVGDPAEVNWRERVLILIGRRLMTWGYQRGYGKFDREAWRRLRPLVIAQRLGDGIAEERGPLERMLPKALAEAERG